jgi:alkanesulfonate monooxygenase SsuD/methylene tetrahydromethanopterin reductase-like flavin-dependent oxidoreductase (luciferase family)
MLGINVYAADSERDARTLMSSRLQSTLNLRLGRPGRLPPPVEDFEDRLGAMERAIVAEMNGVAVIGTRGQVRDGFAEFIAKTGADELIIASQIYDHQARVHSYEIAAGARADLGKQESR